jgi:hypothetical protein
MKKTGLWMLGAVSLWLAGCGDTEALQPEPLGETQQALGRNTSVTNVIVVSQNTKMLMLGGWPNFVKCLADPACNGAGAVPDIILLQETSDQMAREQILPRLKLPVSSGGTGITSWALYAVDGWNDVSRHWHSNAIIYNYDRFTSTGRKAVGYYTGSGSTNDQPCAIRNYALPYIQLRDEARARAGYTHHTVSVAVRHDDHFGYYKFTCPASNLPADAEFCTWRNSKLINDTMYPGSLKIMAGDWNYKAKTCEYNGVTDSSWKYAYQCTTWHIDGCTASGGNLGFTDPRSRQNPAVYDASSPVDYMHHKYASSTFLPTTPGNPTPAVLNKTFYGIADSQAWSDHNGLLMRFSY